MCKLHEWTNFFIFFCLFKNIFSYSEYTYIASTEVMVGGRQIENNAEGNNDRFVV